VLHPDRRELNQTGKKEYGLTSKANQSHTRIPSNLAFTNRMTIKVSQFVRGIGLPLEAAEIHEKTFLPGISIYNGVLLVDEGKLKHPGDLLHEAGHLATTAPEQRSSSQVKVGDGGGDEMMAIAWSWAALVYLELDPAIVFHADGCRGGSESIIENFSNGRFFGVPMLQWLGMTVEEKYAEELGVQPYPHMIKWLRHR
jgi:hypothetical protein